MPDSKAMPNYRIIGATACREHDRPVPVLPSPFEVQNVPPHETACAAAGRASRGGMILAEARKLVVERRFVGLTIKELSARSGLSTQTIHNHFGDRLSLLACAINDYSLALWRYAGQARLAESQIVSFAIAFAQSCEHYPKLFSNILPNTYFSCSGTIVYTRTHAYGCSLFMRELNEMLRCSAIDRRVDLSLVAMALSDVIGETVLNWARGVVRTADLHYQLRYKVELILGGMLAVDRARSAVPA